jgi:hypothetical protein
MHGHPTAMRRRVPRTAQRGDYLFAPSPSSGPSPLEWGGAERADEPRGVCVRRCTSRVDRTDPSEGSRRRFGGRVPSSNRFRAPLSSCWQCYERRNRSRVLPTPGGFAPRKRGASHVLGIRFPQLPAKGDAFRRTPRCVSPPCACVDPEDRSSLSRTRTSCPRSTCAPKNTDALQFGRACTFLTAPRCPA